MVGGWLVGDWWVFAIAFPDTDVKRNFSSIPEFRGESDFDSPEASFRTEKQDKWLSHFSGPLL